MKIRTRSTNITIGGNNAYHKSMNESTTYSSYVPYIAPYSAPVLRETISYENNGKRIYGYCDHRSSLSSYGVGQVKDPYSGSQHIYEGGLLQNLIGGWQPTFSAEAELRVDLLPWNYHQGLALDAMLPSLSSGSSLVTFVRELKDIKKFPDLWKGWKKTLTKFYRSVKNGRKATAKELLAETASSHLNLNFGWLPFMSDVWGLYKSLSTIHKSIEDFQNRSGKPQRRHFKRDVSVDLGIVNSDTSVGNNGGRDGFVYKRLVHSASKAVYCATMVYQYNVPDLRTGSNRIRAYLDRLGVNLNPEILWDAIPFSFVVDWFFDVGRQMGRMRLDNIQPRVNIFDFCHSVKAEQTSTMYWRNQIGQEYWLGSTTRKRYLRFRVEKPYYTPGLVTTLPSGGQVLTGTALLISFKFRK